MLNISYTHIPWTSQEDEQLKDLILKYGPQWSLIAKSFPNRIDVFLKNIWVNIQRRDKRESFQKSISFDLLFSIQNNLLSTTTNIPLHSA